MTEASQGANASNDSVSGSSNNQVSGKRVYVPEHKTAPTNAEPPKPAPTFKGTKHKVRVEGQEFEVDYDDLLTGYQKAQASSKRFQEASKIHQESKPVIEALEKGDIKFLVNKLGPDRAKQLFEDYLVEQMEYESLSPIEKKAIEAERRAKQLEEQLEARKKQDAEAEQKEKLTKAHDEVDAQVSEALKKIGKKPTPRLVVRIVDEMISDMTTGNDTFDADKASAKAIRSVHQDISEFLSDMSAADAIQILPPQLLKAIREYEVQQVMGEKSKIRVKPEAKPQSNTASNKAKSITEAFKSIEQRFAR